MEAILSEPAPSERIRRPQPSVRLDHGIVCAPRTSPCSFSGQAASAGLTWDETAVAKSTLFKR